MSKQIYPLTIVSDRYGGTYSDAGFTAWNLNHDEVPLAISSDDGKCADFWFYNKNDYVYIVGKGATPELAIKDLEQKLQYKELRDKMANTKSLSDVLDVLSEENWFSEWIDKAEIIIISKKTPINI